MFRNDEIEVLLGLDYFYATGAGIFPKQGILRFDMLVSPIFRQSRKKRIARG
jgi:hypothetical protein